MTQEGLSARAKSLFKLIEFDDDEELVGEIRKHPFGLILIYLGGGFVIVALFALLVVAPSYMNGDPIGLGFDLSSIRPYIIVAGLLLCALAVVSTLVGTYLYQANVVLVTSEKIAQVLYKTIFDRKISQLSIGDVQDVTVAQTGIFARFFNYGTLVIETAGEQQNYTFSYTPNPYEVAKLIVGSHERNVIKYGN